MWRDFQNVCLPYCLQRQEDGRYLILNRFYKPIGFNTSEWLQYEDYPVALKFRYFSVREARKLSWSGSDNKEVIYLYADSCSPRGRPEHFEAYFERLKVLARLKLAYEQL